MGVDVSWVTSVLGTHAALEGISLRSYRAALMLSYRAGDTALEYRPALAPVTPANEQVLVAGDPPPVIVALAVPASGS